MADLITQAQFEARIGRVLTATETTRFNAYADDASGLIRRYTGMQFEAVSAAEFVGRPVGTKIRLPHRPVTAVDSVTAIGWAGVPDIALPAAGGWGWDGLDIVEIYPFSSEVWLVLPEAWNEGEGAHTYRIVYDHGAADENVVGVAFAMIARVLLSPSMVEGLTSERIGQYGYQLGQFQGGAGPGAAVRLTEADKDALADLGYRPKKRATTVQMAF